MRRLSAVILALIVISVVVSSCSYGISIQDAANGKAKCGRNHLR